MVLTDDLYGPHSQPGDVVIKLEAARAPDRVSRPPEAPKAHMTDLAWSSGIAFAWIGKTVGAWTPSVFIFRR